MQPPHELYGAWDEACRRERAAWQLVKDKLPGTLQFDPALWDQWREAMQAQDLARERLAQALDRWSKN